MPTPTLLALLPCGLRNPFKSALYSKFTEYVNDIGESEKLIIDGNLNYEKTFYDSIEQMDNLNELPDILITSDINSFYHKGFLSKYLNTSYFESFQINLNSSYKQVGYNHPEGLFVMLPSNVLVIVGDTEKIEKTQTPAKWKDLLHKQWRGRIALRGDKDFFCNAVFFPIVKNYGMESLIQLAQNTGVGLHPSQMAKMMNSNNTGDISLYVMPYTFYKNIKDKERFKLIWPEEGAIVSPVQMLVKKGTYDNNKEIVDYIMSDEMINLMLSIGFPINNQADSMKLNWLGWDYIYSQDICQDKIDMQKLFFDWYNKNKQEI